jgi:hypothetical protein
MGPIPGAALALAVPFLAAGADPAAIPSCEIEAEGALSTKRVVRFELEVERDASEAEPEGHVLYRDPTAGLHFRSTHLTSLEIAGSKGTVRGSGMANGAAAEFTIEVEDAKPGGDPDRLGITLSTGYTAAGEVVGGEVEIECEDEEESRISRPGAGGGTMAGKLGSRAVCLRRTWPGHACTRTSISPATSCSARPSASRAGAASPSVEEACTCP